MMIKSLLRKKQPSLKKPSDFYSRINQISYELFISEINQVIYSIDFVYVSVLQQQLEIFTTLRSNDYLLINNNIKKIELLAT